MASPKKAAHDPSEITALLRRATAHHQRGHLREAEQIYRRAHAPAEEFRRLASLRRADASARLACRGAGTDRPGAEDQCPLGRGAVQPGIVLAALERPDEALASYDSAIALAPDYAEAFNSRGNAQSSSAAPKTRWRVTTRRSRSSRAYGDALVNRASLLRLLGPRRRGGRRLCAALALDPQPRRGLDHASAIPSRCFATIDDALTCFDRALALRPDHAEILNNRGNALW